MKKIITPLTAALTIIFVSAYRLFAPLAENIAGAIYSPNTGDTPWQIIIFVGIAIVAVGLLVFISTRKKR